jgi:arylsulfatase A-like enzyme
VPLSTLATPASTANAITTAPAQTSPTRTPNVLLVTIDTLRADRVGPGGFQAARTPTLDRLARQGVYAGAYVQQPQTTPNHATKLTGTYVQTHGLRTTLWEKAREDVPTIDQIFKQAGYRTAALLSWYSFDDYFTGLKRDWETWQFAIVRSGTQELVGPETARELLDAGAHMEGALDGDARVTTDAALHWLEAYGTATDRPWLFWMHYRDPHYPFAAPPPFDALPDNGSSFDGSNASVGKITGGYQPTAADLERLLAAYDGEIAYTDYQLGRVVDALERLNLTQNTILVVTADHGEAFLEHGDWLHGLSLYQSGVHVPLVVRYPAHERIVVPGHRIEVPVQSADIAPTLLQLCHLPVPETMEGRPFVPLLSGTQESGPLRGAWGTISDGSLRYTVEGDWKLIQRSDHDPRPTEELYNLKDDPGETHNLVDEAPEPAAHLRAVLNAWLEAKESGQRWRPWES